MRDNGNSNYGLGILLLGLVVLAAMTFIMTGGDLGGAQKVESDADLPQVTSPATPPGGTRTPADNTGAR